MERYSISTVIQLYSAGLISRAALEQEAYADESRAKRSEMCADAGRSDNSITDLRPDANGVWCYV